MNPIDREGTFRASIEEYGLKEMESGSVSICIKCKILEQWNPTEQLWESWASYTPTEVEGDIWIVKKDNGGINQKAAESLMRNADWDGDLEAIANNTWQPKPIQIAVKNEVYNGQSRFKISFVNDYDRAPGMMSNVKPEQVAQLKTRFGSQFRAIAGNARRNSVPAALAGSPPRPPAPSKNGAPPPQSADAEVLPDGHVPF